MPTLPRFLVAFLTAVLIFAAGGAVGRATIPQNTPRAAAILPLPGAPVSIVDSAGNQLGGSASSFATGLPLTGSTATFTLTHTSPAAASTVTGTPLTGLGAYHSCGIDATLTGAAGGTLDVYIQSSPDGGTTWYDFVHYTQLAASGAAVSWQVALSKATGRTVPTAVGLGTTPALGANLDLGSDWGDRLRTLDVAGAGTTAGAVQTILLICST